MRRMCSEERISTLWGISNTAVMRRWVASQSLNSRKWWCKLLPHLCSSLKLLLLPAPASSSCAVSKAPLLSLLEKGSATKLLPRASIKTTAMALINQRRRNSFGPLYTLGRRMDGKIIRLIPQNRKMLIHLTVIYDRIRLSLHSNRK